MEIGNGENELKIWPHCPLPFSHYNNLQILYISYHLKINFLVELFYRGGKVVEVGWGRETNEGSCRGEGLRRRIKVFNNFMFMK